MEFRVKIDLRNRQYEIARANRVLKGLMERITELEKEVGKMVEEDGKDGADKDNNNHNKSYEHGYE